MLLAELLADAPPLVGVLKKLLFTAVSVILFS